MQNRNMFCYIEKVNPAHFEQWNAIKLSIEFK